VGKELIDAHPGRFDEIFINGVKGDSGQVEPGDLFICVSNNPQRLHGFLEESHRRKAAFMISGAGHPAIAPNHLSTSEVRELLGACLFSWHREKLQKLNLYGVTGTDGKTSVNSSDST